MIYICETLNARPYPKLDIKCCKEISNNVDYFRIFIRFYSEKKKKVFTLWLDFGYFNCDIIQRKKVCKKFCAYLIA